MDIQREIQRYLKETGLPPTRFGRLAVNDPRLIGDMQRGRQLGVAVRTRILRYIAEHRP